ncbi:AAA family ATPase [Synechococcus sp. A10-1-5-1]|uniref:ATP-dependent DNA helicase n=1 Tax=Synechococcus sp. A10-1-5-1 TaxID=2936507 RepID=UPI0020017E68|nr:AAA family ATPase [Synechococcus sp. A10-1-5-1]UPM50137.1 AAA family ATPase [Synechococcus sp. A10-1-5-1]
MTAGITPSARRAQQEQAERNAHITAVLANKLQAFSATTEQQAAINGLIAWCRQDGGGTFSSFNGPAGSGKSTTSRLIREALMAAGYSVGLCAPTHKACDVLAKACGVAKSETATFASLLGLREQKKKDEVDFVPQYGSKPRLDENDIWLADEASMMHPKLLGYIEDAADFWTKIVFIGDQAQLAPVKFGRVSPALRCTPRFDLTKVMRHDGAVLDAATAIRQTTGNTWRPKFTKSVIGDDSSIFVYADKKEWQHAFLEMAAEHHEKDDPDAFRVIAFTNEEVARLNAGIRRHVYGRQAAPFLAGERVVTQDGVKAPDDHSELLYGSSRELVIEQAQQADFLHPACSDGKPFLSWYLLVQSDDGDPPRWIRTIDPSHQGRLLIAIEALREEAKEKMGRGQGQGAWDEFWNLRDSFAELQPYWCMTCHKAQGSQFHNVFIQGREMDRAAGGAAERRRLWYTAFTRAQRAVHLIADAEVQG